ncbi:MAG TPA: glycosyltransferase family 39 protein [Candidatus Acidoferrales bacterium]|nr:glycosyltransferase family 39 protein [Candidatus Acidoferrales bacterium]
MRKRVRLGSVDHSRQGWLVKDRAAFFPEKEPPLFRNPGRLLFWIIALAGAVRLVPALRADPVAFDSALYFEMARFIGAGAWARALSYPYPPFYPFLIACLESLGIPTAAAGLFWSFGLGVATIVPLYLLARALGGSRIAFAAAFLWAIHPYATRLGVRALSDTTTAFFVALALCVGLYALKAKRLSLAALAGASSALAYLARPEGIEAALGLAAIYVLFTPSPQSSPASRCVPARAQVAAATAKHVSDKRGNGSLPRPIGLRIAWATAPLFGFALVAAPYIAYISAEAGSFTLSKKKSVQAMVSSINARAPVAEPSLPPREKGPAAAPPASVEPAGAAKPVRLSGWAQSVYIFQQPLVNGVYPVVLLLAALGTIGIIRRKIPAEPPAVFLLPGLAGMHLFILVGVAADQGAEYLGGHHFFLLLLYLVPFAGAGLVSAADWISGRVGERRRAAVAVVAVCFAATAPAALKWRESRGEAVRAAGLWARERLRGARAVVARSAKFSFHAGARRIPVDGNVREIVNGARKNGAAFVGAYAHSPESSQLRELVASGDLALAAEFRERSGKRTYSFQVYRILPATEDRR